MRSLKNLNGSLIALEGISMPKMVVGLFEYLGLIDRIIR
jgi:hypothetical protein